MFTDLPLLIQLRERQSKPVKVADIPQSSNQFRWLPILQLWACHCPDSWSGGLSTLDRVGFEYDISNLRKQGLSYEELSDSERALGAFSL